MSGIATFVGLVVGVTLFVANRHTVRFSLDPFHPGAPAIWIDLPMWVYLLAMFLVGALAGALVIWMGQGKWRRQVRSRTQEAIRWKGEADRLVRERDAAGGAPGPSGARKPLALARH